MTDPNSAQHICVLGLGNLGSALAEALLAGGHNVTVWNRTAERCTPLKKLGANVAASPAKAARFADVILICVFDRQASKTVLESKGTDAALKGKIIIQFTTLEPACAEAEDEWMRLRGGQYLEGVLLGFPADVRDGTAKMAFSGRKEVFDGAQAVLSSLASKTVHVNEQPGKASQVALLVYARYYGLTFACLHTAALAKAAGIPIRNLLDLTGGDDNWKWMGQVMDGYLEMVDKADYSTSEATLELDAGDYDMFVRLCRGLDVDPAHHKVIGAILSKAVAQGWGDKAIPAICEVLSPGRDVK
jgi:3-hydroxyisobutyrate dehydrogenase-like beta-hydroxyacid dehydrogenase